MNYDKILYGHNDKEGIVDVVYTGDIDGQSYVREYVRRGETVTEEDFKFYPFYFLTDINLIKGFGEEKFRWSKLKGDNEYQYLVVFNNMADMWDSISFVRGGDKKFESDYIYRLKSPEQMYLSQTGKTLFKGMNFDELHRLQFDIETYSLTRFPKAEEDPIIIMAVSDNRGYEMLLCNGENKTNRPKNDKRIWFDTERDMLQYFVSLVKTLDPDILEHYNGFSYDLPYIAKRCEVLEVEFDLSRDGTPMEVYNSSIRFAERKIDYPHSRFRGRHMIDGMFLVLGFDVIKRDMPSHTLKASAKYFGLAPEGRTYVEGKDIGRTWDEDPEKLLAYAIDDVYETRMIIKRLASATFYTTQMLPLTYQKVAVGGSGMKIESLFVREYTRQRCSLPKPEVGHQDSGGYTRAFYKGAFGPIVYADVESLYPSIMIKYKVQPERDNLEVFQYTIKRLTDLRLSTKKEMKAAKEDALREELDARQSSFKIIINSMYGVCSSDNFIFNDYSEGERVATTGQEIIRNMMDSVLNRGGKVVEGDSVTGDTPVYLRNIRNGDITIQSIATLHSSNEKRRFDGYEDLEILTRGGWKKIKYTKRHYTEKRILDVRTSCSAVSVTEDHSLFSNGKEVKPSELNKGDFIDLYKLPPLPTTGNNNYEVGWLLGAMAADGSASRVKRKTGGYSTNVSCSKRNIEHLNKVKNLALKYFNTEMKLYNTLQSSGCNKIIGGYNKEQYDLWFGLLYDKETKQKKVTEIVLNGGPDIKKGFIEGAMAGDGYVSPEGLETYTTKSRVLAAGIFWLCKDLGYSYRTTVGIRRDKDTVVTLNFQRSVKGYRYEENNIRNVFDRPTGVDVYDVSTEDGTFITGVGGVVAHNTDGIMFVPPDNVFVGKKEDCPEGMMWDEDFVREINKDVPEGIVIGFDGRFKKMFSYAAKNYALLGFDGEIKTKGGSFKNRKEEKFGREFVSEVLKAMLYEDIDAMHKAYIDTRYKIMTGGWTVDDFSKTETLVDSLEEYKRKLKETNRNKSAVYELALIKKRKKEQVGKGERLSYYIKTAPKKMPSFEVAKLAEEWDPEHPDENTKYYLDKLDGFAEKFKDFFKGPDYRLIFSEENLFGFSSEGIKILQIEVE